MLHKQLVPGRNGWLLTDPQRHMKTAGDPSTGFRFDLD